MAIVREEGAATSPAPQAPPGRYESIFEYPDLWYALEREHFGEDLDRPRRVYEGEVEYLLAMFELYSPHEVNRILEVACGNCPHGRILTGLGYQIVGIDYSRPMLDAARTAAAKDGVRIHKLYQRNTERFTLPEEPFDAAMVLSETMPCGFDARTGALFNRAMVSHLQSMARALRPGAVYFLDFSRRGQLFNPKRVIMAEKWRDQWIPVPDAVLHRRLYQSPDDVFQNQHVTMQRCTVYYEDGRVLETFDRWREPWLLPLPYLSALVDLSGTFRYVAAHEYGSLEPGLSLQDWSTIWLVLQRL